MYICMYVCLSIIMSLQVKYTGLCIVCISFWHVLLMVPLQRRTWWIKDISRLENESRDIDDGQLGQKTPG